MIKKLKNLLKVKDYKVKESYSEGGYDIKVKEDDNAEKMISLREPSHNQLIEVTMHENKIKHIVFDQARGIKTEIDIPMSVYRKIM